MTGRPTLFTDACIQIAHQLALLGYDDRRIAEACGLKTDRSDDPFKRWRHRYPGFAEALKRGREVSRGKVAASLYERAIGYSHESVKIFPPRVAGAPPVVVPYIERFPPETQAAMFILTNREPELWSHRQTVEHDISSRLAERLEAARLRQIAQTLEPPTLEGASLAEEATPTRINSIMENPPKQ